VLHLKEAVLARPGPVVPEAVALEEVLLRLVKKS
jgi:hypothetical protein